MGLLDEAIRDHFELKRRHGADPGEVARLEHEALGPARREPATATPVEPAVPYDDEDYDEVPADERLDAPAHHGEPHVAPEPAPAAPAEPEGPADEPPVGEQHTQQVSLEELEAASDAPAGPAETTEDVASADDEPDAHDELEETPEFLQETPEHDRLWFEQKPPRDFDF
jgi:hypothetical protein